jgi:hypothetical protein
MPPETGADGEEVLPLPASSVVNQPSTLPGDPPAVAKDRPTVVSYKPSTQGIPPKENVDGSGGVIPYDAGDKFSHKVIQAGGTTSKSPSMPGAEDALSHSPPLVGLKPTG